MPRIRAEDDSFEVPLTPLIDVVFLLLIFFLVATNFSQKELDQQVTLPEAEGGVEAREIPETLVINIRQGGELIVNGHLVDASALPEMVRAFHAKYPKQSVAIRGDRAVSYQAVMRIMGLCRAAGIRSVDLPVAMPQDGDAL